jgi:filamentous hemagglutinin family protein
MKHVNYQFLLLHSIFNCVFAISSAGAEIIPDATLPVNSVVSQTGSVITISGGTKANENLFHSFESFNIPKNIEASFNNSTTVKNIITRITGNNASQIDGLLSTASKANVFLINPNGIIFGENARLNVGGSFVATSAENIKFADGTIFSTRLQQNTPLLTVSAPIGLSLGNNSGAIIVQGQGHDLSGSPFNRQDYTSGLKVEPGQTIALVGGKINLDGGILTAPDGRVELSSIKGQGFVNINANSDFSLTHPKNLNFDSIELSKKSLIDTNGTSPGIVKLYGGQINLKDGSLIWLQNRGILQSHDIEVFASEGLKLTDTTANGIPSGIINETIAEGTGANINITTPILNIYNGAVLSANTYNSGQGGNININSQNINVFAYSPSLPRSVSSISAFAYSQGNAGHIDISGQSLLVFEGGSVGSVTTGSGSSGNVNIKSKDIQISGRGPLGDVSSITSSSVSNGSPGKINIDTARLKISNGGLISSSSFSNSSAGNVTINASDVVEVTGKSGSTTSQIRSAVRIFASELEDKNQAAILRSQLKLPDIPQGNAGDVTINASSVQVSDGARISVQNQGIGNGGTIHINDTALVVKDRGSITANTASGVGGDIQIKSTDVRLQNNGDITATAVGNIGSGGNISIDTKTLVATNNSDIVANAQASFGGRITINATGIIGTQPSKNLTTQSNITATSQQGSLFNGVVSINSFYFNPNIATIELPSTIVQATDQITTGCAASAGNRFVAVGRGGLPENPTDALKGETLWSDFRYHQNEDNVNKISIINPSVRQSEQPLIEANLLVKDASGNIELVAHSPHQEHQVLFKCPSSP